jgi:hypothetical protein
LRPWGKEVFMNGGIWFWRFRVILDLHCLFCTEKSDTKLNIKKNPAILKWI